MTIQELKQGIIDEDAAIGGKRFRGTKMRLTLCCGRYQCSQH